jgi:hypothetical protein
VYSQDGAVVSNYVSPAIEVSEDAYVFAVMMDLDGRIQVLQPDDPGISVRLRSNKQLRLPNFFAGFNAPMQRDGRYTSNGLSYDNVGRAGEDSRGTVIALASRAPFKLDLIEANGDWDISEIRRLIEYRSPASASNALAQYLGVKGESIGRDYMRFARQRQSYYAYDSYGYNDYGYDNRAYCGYGYGYGSMGVALSITNALNRAASLPSTTNQPVIIGYDSCGFPVIVAAQVAPGRGTGRPVPPRQPGDTTVFPKARLPRGAPRTPPRDADAETRTIPVGVFPVRPPEPRTEGWPVAEPDAPRAEPPRGVSDRFRPQPVTTTLPDRQPPIERTQPQADPSSGGRQPEYRSEPRVIERPVPVAAPERIPEPARAPAPVIYERPSAPPPPPPRMEPTPSPRMEPTPSPTPPPARTAPETPPPKNQ